MKMVVDANTNEIIMLAKTTKKVANGLQCDAVVIGVEKNEAGDFTGDFPKAVTAPKELPEDFAPGKYLWQNTKFVNNPNYEPTDTEKLEQTQILLDDAMSLLLEAGVL